MSLLRSYSRSVLSVHAQTRIFTRPVSNPFRKLQEDDIRSIFADFERISYQYSMNSKDFYGQILNHTVRGVHCGTQVDLSRDDIEWIAAEKRRRLWGELKRFKMFHDPDGIHFTFPVKRGFRIFFHDSFRAIEDYMRMLDDESVTSRDHAFKAEHEKLVQSYSTVQPKVLKAFTSIEGESYDSLSAEQKHRILIDIDDQEVDLVNQLITRDQESLKSDFSNRWSDLYHIPNVTGTKHNEQLIDAIDVAVQIRLADRLSKLDNINLHPHQSKDGFKKRQRVNVQVRILKDARKKYNFHPLLRHKQLITFYNTVELKSKGLDLTNLQATQKYKTLPPEEKLKLKKTFLKYKMSFVEQNRLASLAAIRRTDWMALQLSEVKLYGSPTDREQYVEWWEKTGVLRKVDFVPKVVANGFRLLKPFSSRPMFVDLELLRQEIENETNMERFYETRMEKIDDQPFTRLHKEQKKIVYETRRLHIHSKMAKFKADFDKENVIKLRVNLKRPKYTATLNTIREFVDQFVDETINEEDIKFLADLEKLEALAKEGSEAGYRLYHAISLEKDFFHNFEWATKSESLQRFHLNWTITAAEREEVQIRIENFIQKCHDEVKNKYKNEFYVPHCVLYHSSMNVPAADRVLHNAEMQLFRQLKEAHSAVDEDTCAKRNEEKIRERIFKKYRWSYSFPPSLNPPRPIDEFAASLQKEGKHWKEARVDRTWSKLSQQEKAPYQEKVKEEIEQFRSQLKAAAEAAAKEKNWLALQRHEVMAFGSVDEVEEYDQAWKRALDNPPVEEEQLEFKPKWTAGTWGRSSTEFENWSTIAQGQLH